MHLWPWGLFASLLGLWAGLDLASRRLGTARVDQWVFAHRDRLPIPFLIVGVVTRLASHGVMPPGRRGQLEMLGAVLVVLGELIRVWSVGIVGAATRSASTHATRLVQEGPYVLVRNPIYVGNFLLCIGLACFAGSWVLVMACSLYFVPVYGRVIRAEERFLGEKFGSAYEAFCRRVPRIVPRMPWSWQALRSPFSWRELRKEYQTIAGIVCAMLLIQLVMRAVTGAAEGVSAPGLRSGCLSSVCRSLQFRDPMWYTFT